MPHRCTPPSHSCKHWSRPAEPGTEASSAQPPDTHLTKARVALVRWLPAAGPAPPAAANTPPSCLGEVGTGDDMPQRAGWTCVAAAADWPHISPRPQLGSHAFGLPVLVHQAPPAWAPRPPAAQTATARCRWRRPAERKVGRPDEPDVRMLHVRARRAGRILSAPSFKLCHTHCALLQAFISPTHAGLTERRRLALLPSLPSSSSSSTSSSSSPTAGSMAPSSAPLSGASSSRSDSRLPRRSDDLRVREGGVGGGRDGWEAGSRGQVGWWH